MSAAPSVHHRHVDTLYSEHHRWLQGWLSRRLGNAFEAADLAQDTFVRLLGASSAPAEGALRAPRAALATVARRELLYHLRRRALEPASVDALAVLPEAQAPSPEQQLVILQALQEVDAMLDGLPSKVRSVFILSQIDGLTYAAIAEEMKSACARSSATWRRR